MSSGEDAVSSKSAEATAGTAFRRADALPCKDGGGIVFPRGPLGRGFYLDEWSFIRYCTKRAEEDHAIEQKSKPWLGLALLIIFGLIIAVLIAADMGLQLPAVAPTATVCWAGIVIFTFYSRLKRTDSTLAEAFPGLRPMPYFSCWTQRIILAATCGGRWWLWTHANTTFWILYTARLAFDNHERHGSAIEYAYKLLALGIFEGLFFLSLITTYLGIWLRLGRKPTADDLVPV